VSFEDLLESYSEELVVRVTRKISSRLDQIIPPTADLHSVTDEIKLIYNAAKHERGFKWSVIPIAQLILESDVKANEISERLGFSRVAVYNGLRRLQESGFCTNRKGFWCLREDRCPVLYWLTRRTRAIMITKS
jgi:CRP-like cAMP-binding protein